MICKNCSLAGDLIERYRNEKRLKTAEFTLKSTANSAQRVFGAVASGLHGLCLGCDCQHILDWNGHAVQKSGSDEISRVAETSNRSTFRSRHVKEEYEKLAGEGGS